MKNMPIILTVILLLSGCVSKKVHLAEKQSLQKQLADTQKELEETKKQFKAYQAAKEAEIDEKRHQLRKDME